MEIIGSRLLHDETGNYYEGSRSSCGDVIMEVEYDDQENPESIEIIIFRVEKMTRWVQLDDEYLKECRMIADNENEEGTRLYEKYDEVINDEE